MCNHPQHRFPVTKRYLGKAGQVLRFPLAVVLGLLLLAVFPPIASAQERGGDACAYEPVATPTETVQ